MQEPDKVSFPFLILNKHKTLKILSGKVDSIHYSHYVL